MFYSNVILAKKKVKTEGGAVKNMVVAEMCNTKQTISRLQKYQAGINRLIGFGQRI